MSEYEQTAAVVEWFKLQYSKYAGCIIGIPNGAHLAGNSRTRAIKMAKLKREGIKPGCSDLFIAVPKQNYSGLWVEMKDTNKTLCSLSKEQQEHLDLMRDMGYEAIWCAGFDAAKAAIQVYMEL